MEESSLLNETLSHYDDGDDEKLYSDYVWSDFEIDHPASIIAIIYFITLIGMGTVGNALVIAAFIVHRPLRAHSINIFVVQSCVVNLIVSAIINPFYCVTLFIQVHNDKLLDIIDVAAISLAHSSVVLSIYSHSVVAVNRYLLIARPTTTYRKCCVGRRSITLVLAAIWIAVIVTSAPFWAVVLYDISVGLDDRTLHIVCVPFTVFICLWFLPMLIVPVMQIATFAKIRMSRMQVESMRVILHRPKVAPLPCLNTGEEAIATNHSDLANSLAVPNSGILSNNSRGITSTNRPSSPAASSRMSRIKCPKVVRKKGEDNANRNPANSEVLIIKITVLTCVLLFISLLPEVLSLTPAADHTWRYLPLYGYFAPIYPAFMPYVFLWSNSNFRSAVANLPRKVS